MSSRAPEPPEPAVDAVLMVCPICDETCPLPAVGVMLYLNHGPNGEHTVDLKPNHVRRVRARKTP